MIIRIIIKISDIMTNLRELRLNNWVYSLEIGGYVQIASIDSDCVTLKDHVTWDYVYADMIEPIPLTEEILLKCGFVARGTFWFDLHLDQKTKLTLGWYTDGRIDFEISVNKICFDVSHIKHLHQLQNLYHYLTGEELKIEL